MSSAPISLLEIMQFNPNYQQMLRTVYHDPGGHPDGLKKTVSCPTHVMTLPNIKALMDLTEALELKLASGKIDKEVFEILAGLKDWLHHSKEQIHDYLDGHDPNNA